MGQAPLRFRSDCAQLADEDIDRFVVGIPGHAGDDLDGEAEPDPDRSRGQSCKKPVVVTASLAESAARGVEGDPGDDDDIEFVGQDRLARGFVNAPVTGDERSDATDWRELERIADDPRQHWAHAAREKPRDRHGGVRLVRQRGVQRHGTSTRQLGQGEEVVRCDGGGARSLLMTKRSSPLTHHGTEFVFGV